MPKMTDRERLAKIEADQSALASEAESVRRSLRAHYGKLVADLPAERLSDRDFRDVLMQAVRVGGGAAVAALKALPAGSDAPPEKRAASEPEGPRRRKSVSPATADGGQEEVQP